MSIFSGLRARSRFLLQKFDSVVRTLISVTISLLFVTVSVYGATTISTNIQTGGTLTVTGIAHFTDDINVNGRELNLGTGSATTTITGLTATLTSLSGDLDLYGGDLGLGTGSATTTLTSASSLLGIGTTTPGGRFSISAISVGTTPVFLVSTSTATATGTALIINSNGRLGIGGVNLPTSVLDVTGNAAIGSNLAGVSAAPSNGLLVQGITGIGGTTSPAGTLSVSGSPSQTNATFLVSTSTATATTTALIINSNGRLGIGGVNLPTSVLDVTGNVAIGSNRAGVNAAPSNGLLVQGITGIGGTTSPAGTLSVSGQASQTNATFLVSTSTATATTTAILVDSDGRVGLGATTTLTRQLGVVGDIMQTSGGTTTLVITSSGTGFGSCIELRGSSSSDIYRIYIGNKYASATPLMVEVGSCR
ncbi:MAG: hypothetical protein G01um101472_231 [Parcubacteria group bacterium Gr01-1014_72]|nr:MAG: hypothetical protein G01um101472_231 [Parcubacteria group bacterium Gr01-1014_72]